MSLLTTLRAPGTGRRQSDPVARVTAENQRLDFELQQERTARQTAQADLRRTVATLGEIVVMHLRERAAHQETKAKLATAVRANECNVNAETVKTDVTALRAATADVVDGEPAKAGPQYRPYRRILRPLIKVVPLWSSPQAAHPARIPSDGELAVTR